jgi:hypothetical protein
MSKVKNHYHDEIVARASSERGVSVNDDPDDAAHQQQVKHMVDRFLSWKLPSDFSPDGGISFNAAVKQEPIGTNLLTATQATAMVRHMLDDLPTENSK